MCAEIWHGMAASGGCEENGWNGGILDVIFKEKSVRAPMRHDGKNTCIDNIPSNRLVFRLRFLQQKHKISCHNVCCILCDVVYN